MFGIVKTISIIQSYYVKYVDRRVNMDRFIRGLDDLEKLSKVLTCMGYNKYDDNFYTLSTAKLKREKGHYIYIENGKKLIFRFYNVNSIIILPLTDVELRLFITKDFLSIELLYKDEKTMFLQQMYTSKDIDVISKMLEELNDYLEEDEE